MIGPTMVSLLETAVRPATPLVDRMAYHLNIAGDTKDPALQSFYTSVERSLSHIPTADAHTFLSKIIWHDVTPHLSPPDIERNGLTWSMDAGPHQWTLVRLYTPSRITDSLAKLLARRLSDRDDSLWLRILHRFEKHRIEEVLKQQTDEDTFYYASAEILVRAMVHERMPPQPIPTALVTPNGEPIGFTLTFAQSITQAKQMELEVVDVFMERGWSDTYGPANLPPAAQRQYDGLKKINVLPYVEKNEDLQNMLLFDQNGRFVTFNRLGYRLPGQNRN